MSSGFDPKLIGSRIKSLRLKAGLSIVELAKKAGVNKNTIVNIEGGDSKTTALTLDKVASVLNISLARLFDPKPLTNIEVSLGEGDYPVNKTGVQKGSRDVRVTVKNTETYELGDIDVHLKNGDLIGGIIEVYPQGRDLTQSHEGEEFFFCLTGRVQITISNEKYILEKGDAIVFWGLQPHNYVSVRIDDDSKKSVGLSVISGSKCNSIKELHEKITG